MITTLITGATGKLGRVLVAGCLARGDTVVALGSRRETVDALTRDHRQAVDDRSLAVIACDLTSHKAIGEIVTQCVTRECLPDNLINGARNLSHLRADGEGLVAREDFVGEFTLDVVVPYELTLALARMPNRRLKRVVNIGSQYGIVAPNRALYGDFERQSFIHYGVAKAALVHLSREMAVRLAPAIRVNCVSFGGVEGRADADFQARYAALTPGGRMLRNDEIFGAVAFLSSDASSGTTGHNLVVDGGWTAW